MKPNSNRSEFDRKTKEILARRAGYLCSICRAITTGPSLESLVSISSIRVAAHITAAAPGGPRYDHLLDNSQRTSISNGIWLCNNHATLIDCDSNTWTVSMLKKLKGEHEEFVMTQIGIPNKEQSEGHSIPLVPKEFGFVRIGDLIEPYRKFIDTIIIDKKSNDNTVIGLLLCVLKDKKDEILWTLFLNSDWLQWFFNGQSQVLMQLQKYLLAMVQTNATFEFVRQPGGYLALVPTKDYRP